MDADAVELQKIRRRLVSLERVYLAAQVVVRLSNERHVHPPGYAMLVNAVVAARKLEGVPIHDVLPECGPPEVARPKAPKKPVVIVPTVYRTGSMAWKALQAARSFGRPFATWELMEACRRTFPETFSTDADEKIFGCLCRPRGLINAGYVRRIRKGVYEIIMEKREAS